MAENPLQKFLSKMNNKNKSRRAVVFAETVQVHEFEKIEVEQIPELFYSKFDFRRFKSEEKFREERAVARAIRRLVGNAVDEMDARLGSCDDVQKTERELISQSFQTFSQEPAADIVAVSSDEDSDEEEEEEERVKPLAIREEKVKARRRTSLLAVPDFKSFAYEDETIGLDQSYNFIDENDLAFDMSQPNLDDLSFMNSDVSDSVDLSFNPVGFETVIDETSGRPSFSFWREVSESNASDA